MQMLPRDGVTKNEIETGDGEMKPVAGTRLKPKKTVKSLSLNRRHIHTVTAVTSAVGEFSEGDGGWWVKTDKLPDEWYAIAHFERVENEWAKSQQKHIVATGNQHGLTAVDEQWLAEQELQETYDSFLAGTR